MAPRVWEKSDITVAWAGTFASSAHIEDDRLGSALQEAFDTWSAPSTPDSRLTFRVRRVKNHVSLLNGDFKSHIPEADITVVFGAMEKLLPKATSRSLAETFEFDPNLSRPIGATYVVADPARIIAFADRDPRGFEMAFLQVLTHEAGHAIGLEHSPVNWTAYEPPTIYVRDLPLLPTMTPVAFQTARFRGDDRAWAQFLYGRAGGRRPVVTIHGKVVDAISQDGVNGLQVLAIPTASRHDDGELPIYAGITPFAMPGRADRDGTFRLAVLPNQSYRLLARHIPLGFKTNRVQRNLRYLSGEHPALVTVGSDDHLEAITIPVSRTPQ